MTAWRARWIEHERSCARLLHGACAHPGTCAALVGLSRVSDGVGWYVLMLALPWFGGAGGTPCLLRMLLVGVLDLGIYKVVKRCFARPRPFVACPGLKARARALDEYSFPSGHTLHAAGFSVVLVAYYPSLAWVMGPLTVLIGVSRVALGLHYPSDVIVGAVTGVLMAEGVLALF